MLKRLLPLLLLLPAIACGQTVLRQSDALELYVGPFVDSTDGATAETALTLSQADVRLTKCTAAATCAAAAQKNDTSSCTHVENGWYECPLNATDTDTVGILVLEINESGALPVFRDFVVVEEAVYDQVYAASATGAHAVSSGGIAAAAFAAGAIDNSATSIDGSELTAIPDVDTLLEALVTFGGRQTADSGTTTTLVDAALTQATTDWFAGQGVIFTNSTLAGQTACITAFTPASDTLTITAVTATVSTQQYYILPLAKCQTGDSFARIGAAGAGLTNIDLPNQTMDVTGNITGNLSGTVGTVNALANNSITDAASATDFETRLTTQAASALNTYDPPTRAEATADKAEIMSMLGQREAITVTDQDTFTLTNGPDRDDAFNPWAVMLLDTSNAGETDLVRIRDYVGASKTVELERVAGFTIATGDIAVFLPSFLDDPVDTAFVNCTVNTANFAGSTTTLACILTDKEGAAVTVASGDLTGLELVITSGAQAYEHRYVFSTTWDGANSELQITLDRALPATIADAVTAIIR